MAFDKGAAGASTMAHRRTWVLASTALAIAVGVNCSGLLGPDSYGDMNPVVGVYLLESVDGRPLPVPLPPQAGCDRSISQGELRLSGPAGESIPFYSWGYGVAVSCNPVPSGVQRGKEDLGNWTFPNPELNLRSERGNGEYDALYLGPLAEETRVRISFEAREYVFRRVLGPNTPTGILFLKFVDQTDAPVAGVRMFIDFPNGLKGGGTTPATGEFGTRGMAGIWRISLELPAGYSLPQSQPNPFEHPVPQGTTDLTIRLIKS